MEDGPGDSGKASLGLQAIDALDVESVTAFVLLVVRSASAAFRPQLSAECIDEDVG